MLSIFVVLLVAYLCQRLLGYVPWPALACTAIVLLVTPVLGVVLLSESTGPNLLAGAVLILFGVALVQRRWPYASPAW